MESGVPVCHILPPPPQGCVQMNNAVDYHAEGERVLGRFLNASSDTSFYEDVSAILEFPSGGKLFIGNIRAASDRRILDDNNIRHVVNCQELSTENYFEEDKEFSYLRFPIANWWSSVSDSSGVLKFYEPLFSFARGALEKKQNVMVHCLAGAHRAGTSGISLAMVFLGLRVSAFRCIM